MAKCVPISTPQFKKCSKCGEIKPINQFYKQQDCKDGYKNACRKCYYIQHRNYAQSERGIIIGRLSDYRYRANHPEAIKIWNQRNREIKAQWKRNKVAELQEKHPLCLDVYNNYPAARLIEALETAPIVEIKI